jgi:hypothetical protein
VSGPGSDFEPLPDGSPWPCEDGGPSRRQTTSALGLDLAAELGVHARTDPVVTMVVTRGPGELYLLRHGFGDAAWSAVERIDPVTLSTIEASAELPGGPTWPGSIAAHADGSLHVVFGNHAHRLSPDCRLLASVELPRPRPYNGFVTLGDGSLVTKDFAGSLPGHPVPESEREPCQLVVLEPEHLSVVDSCTLAEPSVARLTTDGENVYVVGDSSLMRVHWDGARLRPDRDFRIRYRIREGQTYGWDCVLAGGAAWFLDDGDGAERFAGTLRDAGLSSAPLQLLRVDLDSGHLTAAEVCGEPGGLVANPPVIDVTRGVAVGYDTGNGVMTGFDLDGDEMVPRWQRDQDHGAHLVLFEGSGHLLTGDFDASRGADQAVVLDIVTGAELARVDTQSPVQSVLFPAVGFAGDVYVCSLSTVSRIFPAD